MESKASEICLGFVSHWACTISPTLFFGFTHWVGVSGSIWLYHLLVTFALFKKDSQKIASLVAQLVKNPPAMQDTLVRFLYQEDSLEKE